MRLTRVGPAILVALVLTALAPVAGPVSAQEALPEGVTTEMIEEGREVYTGPGLCSVCHGPEGRGGAIGPDLTDGEWLHGDGSYDDLVQRIFEGVPEPVEAAAVMPPRGGSRITDEQVRAVAAYVWWLQTRG